MALFSEEEGALLIVDVPPAWTIALTLKFPLELVGQTSGLDVNFQVLYLPCSEEPLGGVWVVRAGRRGKGPKYFTNRANNAQISELICL